MKVRQQQEQRVHTLTQMEQDTLTATHINVLLRHGLLRWLLLPLGVQGGDCTDGSKQDFGSDCDVQRTIVELVMETGVCASGCSGAAVVVLVLHVSVVVVGGGALIVVVVVVIVVVVLLVIGAVLDDGIVSRVLLC